MANRAILIPELSLTPENISLVTLSGVTAGLKTKAAVRGASNEGRLDPNPIATPSAAYDIDILERTAGNVGGARAGWKDSANSVYRGKSPMHVPHHVQWLEYGTNDANRYIRPKALSMQSGELLVLMPSMAGYLNWFTFTNGVRNAVHSNEDHGFLVANFRMADVVQMKDGELVMMILGVDAQNQIRLMRKTSTGDTDATIEWNFGPADLNKVGNFAGVTLTFAPKGFAIEVMESGRIAMLIKREGLASGAGATDIVRSFSDDRGVTWSDLKTASDYDETGYGLGAPTSYLGGCDITRDPETGSLIAICGVSKSAAPVTFTNEPSVMGLVSDDGDNWTGLVKWSKTITQLLVTSTAGIYSDFPFYEEGMVEATAVYGDDGLLKFIGAFHGDSGNAIVSGYFDDLCMISTRKSGISVKDGAPEIPPGTVIAIDEGLTCSDAFDAQIFPATGLRRPTRSQIALNRFNVTAGTAGGDLDGGAADYAGVRFVEAVNHKGVVYLFMACEDTTAVQYGFGYMILNPWDELFERGGLNTVAASATKGFPYLSTAGWMAGSTPTDVGLTVVNAGAQTLDETTKGLEVAPAAAISTFGATFSAYGFRPNPLLIRFVVKVTAGGSLTQDDIAMRIKASDGTDQIDISIRFVAASIRAYDNVSAATIGTDAIDCATVGVEVVLAVATDLTLDGIFYRALTADPEDAVTVQATASAGYAAGKNGATVVETWVAGTGTATSPESTWMGVWLARGVAASAGGDAFLWDGVNAWDASPPLFPEFTQAVGETPYDDGLSHGSRAPVTRAFGQYYRDGMRVSWKGASGREGNTWDVVSANRFEGENVLRTPVGRYWRSVDDSATVVITWDAGNEARFNPQAIALFGLNAKEFRFQMDTVAGFGVLPVNIDVDVGGAATVDRYYMEIPPAQLTIAGTDNREIVLSAATTQPLTPHQFRSNDRVVWYAWNTGLAKSIRIVDNEGYKIILAATAVGAASSWWIYPDKIGINLSGGVLGQGGGYRYMRIQFTAQNLYEGYYKLGFAMIGQLLNLNTSGMNPEWGFKRIDDVPVSREDLRTGGERVTNLYDGALQRYAFGWSGLRDRAGHAIAGFPGVRDDFMKLIDAYQRTKGGEVPIALFPSYSDGREEAPARSFDVIPARMAGPSQGSQVAYENCRSGDVEGAVKAILNISPFMFTEIP